MLQVLQTYEWFKEVLKRTNTFEDILLQEILLYEYNGVRLELIRLELNRMSNARTILTATAIGNDVDYEIFKYVIYKDISTVHPNIYWFNENDCNLSYSVLHNDTIRFKQYKRDGSEDTSSIAVLDYPLQEEQVFQQLTRFDIPEEEYINRFVRASEEIMSGLPELCNITFRAGYICNQINETNHKIMVQSVMDCMRHLELEEQMRIEKTR
ncbi:hypothetical protein FDG95_gp055 [Pectobacterium phage vB_PcaM_CBB]|uniref:Uncharacterized protein n=1 Tax=Pectobacterium phage vB_PcaM_CBB TaxID=2772511 RepID=A0A1L2CUB9_9CAUD|nr:hypothetical protein FDG95_gp055 [Pectobacterium phage vB_PcaM_CBB]AMM43620.1 hypothetical protein CBB_55 [Pectobacterium phage vB_PcaM_CBB]